MNKRLLFPSLPIGLAMFSMFFGAGNVIYPLAVGKLAGDKNLYAALGLILTTALMPLLGVIAMILYEGNTKHFFGRLGKAPGFFLAFIIISLLGPLGSAPRCIALSYTAVKSFFPLSPTLFSCLACACIFLFTIKKESILSLLGWVLTPLLLVSLVGIIVLGFCSPHDIQLVEQGKSSIFFQGLKEGYNTMDLLAAFFFSSTILNLLQARKGSESQIIGITLRASLIGAFLLSAVYFGFSYLAAFHGAHLEVTSPDEILMAIIQKIAGPRGIFLVGLTITLACLTTAIALISAFTDFFQKEVFKNQVSYKGVLIGALLVTFFVSTFEFTGISAFLGPVLQICYPGLILLTLLNLAYRLKNFKPIKTPVFCAFGLALILFFF